MNKIFNTILTGLIAGITLSSCDRIAPDDYWTPLPEDEIPGNACTVLVEEYTGQHCINCPDAAQLLQAQQKIYKDKLIVVSMHASRTGMTTPELAAPEADRFAEAFKHERSVPGVMLNREILEENKFYSQSPSLWAAEIRRKIMKPATFEVEFLQVETDEENRKISVSASAHHLQETAPKGQFQLGFWIVEDVIAPQALPTGQKEDYFHRNVFRGTLGTGANENYELQQELTFTAELPAHIKVLDNAKVIALLFDASTGQILDSRLYPLGKGITPEPEPEDKPGTNPVVPESESKTLYFNVNSETVWSGAEITVTQSVLLDPKQGMYAMDSPLAYILPGKEYGLGSYEFSVSKMDHEKNADCGLMMVCVDGKCMPATDKEFYKGKVDITAKTLETRQAFSVHTYIQGKASEQADTFRYRIAFFKDGEEIAHLILKLDFTPAAEAAQ